MSGKKSKSKFYFQLYHCAYADEETGEQIITVCQEVKYKDVVQGVVAMDIDASALADYVENIRLLNTGFVMLVDEQGNIVVDSESNTFADGTVADLEFFAPLTEELDKLEEQKAQLRKMKIRQRMISYCRHLIPCVQREGTVPLRR